MQRLPDWPDRLARLIACSARRPFHWATWHCCLWGAAAVQTLTGHDPAAPWRGACADQASAYRLLRELGGLRAVAALAGQRIEPGRAVDGDIALVHDGRRGLLGVHGGQHWLVVGTLGLRSLPMGAAAMAWGVGHG